MCSKFVKNPILSTILIVLIVIILKDDKVCIALGNPSQQGSVYSVNIENEEEETSRVGKVNAKSPNPRVGGNDRNYRYSFDPSIREVRNNGKSRGRFPSVEIKPRGLAGFGVQSGNGSIGGGNIDIIPNISPKVIDIFESAESNSIEWSESRNSTMNPPPHNEVAKMARFIVRNSLWTSMATISTRSPMVGYPFVNIFSVSDGPAGGNSTGIPYMYLTPLDMSVVDLMENSKASITMSLAQGDYCRLKKYDPEDPRCAHVILIGNMIKTRDDDKFHDGIPINNSTTEAIFARKSMFTRHPEMVDWPTDHGWFFAKLDISNILVLDYFGGAKSVTPKEYFKANDFDN